MLKPINHQPHITAVSAPNPMHVFFDTKLTGLTSDPRLLSIGLVADTDATLYLEFTDGWHESACSDWVRQHILPTLGQGERLTRRAAGQRIFDWLLRFDAPLVLLADSDYDTVLLTQRMTMVPMQTIAELPELIRVADKLLSESKSA